MLWTLPRNGCGYDLTALELGPWHCYVAARGARFAWGYVRGWLCGYGARNSLFGQCCSSTT